MTTTEIKFNFEYDRGHPAGYTDDLGILADRNQWALERRPGWYGYARDYTIDSLRPMNHWCKQNLKEDSWHVKTSGEGFIEVYIQNEKDYIMFLLRWS